MNTTMRVNQLRELMSEKGIGLSVIINSENQFYFSGLKAITYSRPILLAVSPDKLGMVVPSLEEKHAKQDTVANPLYVYHETPIGDRSTSYLEHVKRIISEYPTGTRIGVESSSLSLQLANLMRDAGMELISIDEDISKMRAIKTKEELSLITESGRLVSLALKHSLENVKAGMTEIEMDQMGNQELFKEVARTHPDSTLDFFVMTPSGIERSNLPHVFSNTRSFKKQDIAIHSRQVGLNGYRAECERTFFIGQPTEEQEELFNIALQAQLAALNAIKPGVMAKEVDSAARKVFQQHGVEKYCMHRTGHGIGIGQHEEPSLRYDNDLVLQQGMVYCVEPGIYVPGIGGFRHSDTVVLLEDGSHQITEYPRELKDLIF